MLVAALHLGDAYTATELAVFELFEGLAEHDVDIGRQLADLRSGHLNEVDQLVPLLKSGIHDPVNAWILSWVVRAGAWPFLIP